MDIIQRTSRLLEETEKALVGLANEAGAARDYDQAASLIEVAREVKRLAERFIPDSTRPAMQLGDKKAVHRTPEAGSMVTLARGRNKLGSYPRFFRNDGTLIKIGWSKSQKAEYEHKSSKRVLSVLCHALTKIGSNGKRLTMDKVLPLTDPSDGSALPEYQCYVCLAWLRSIGLVVQYGRQGYSLKKGTDLEKAIETSWNNLSTR